MIFHFVFQDGENKDHFQELRDDKGYPIKGEDFVIIDVQPEDAGLYFCAARTSSDLTPGFFNLRVLTEDEAIIQKPKNVTLEEGDTAYFTCQSHGTLLKEATSWVKLDGDNFDVLLEASEVLEIVNITQADQGLYACVVGNKMVNVQAWAYLTVQDPKVTIVPTNNQETYIYVSTFL